jgi:hypothetical protein
MRHCLVTLLRVLIDFGRLVLVIIRSPRALAAENLFPRKQLAFVSGTPRQAPSSQ